MDKNEKWYHKLFDYKRPEHEFMPAILEITESPPSPYGRIIIWTLAALLSLTVLFTYITKIEIIATATGKTTPIDKVKSIQPINTGIIEGIFVKEGDFVKKGDVLMILDPSEYKSNLKQIEIQISKNESRLKAIEILYDLDFENIKSDIEFSGFDMNSAMEQNHHIVLLEEYRSIKTEIDKANQNILIKEKQIVTNQTEINKLSELLPIVTEKRNAIKSLTKRNMASKMDYLEVEEDRISIKYQLDSAISLKDSLRMELKQGINEKNSIINNYKMNLSKEREKMEAELQSYLEELEKIKVKNQNQILVSPIDGVVEGMKHNTIGGVVTTAEEIMSIVPSDSLLEIESFLTNKDIGFVEVGQEVIIKIDAFNFTKYGTLKGKVIDISNDAFEDERMGLVFKSKIALLEDSIYVNDKEIKVTSGMSVTAEIKTGSRRVIEFLLSPIQKVVNESIKER